MVPNAKKTKKTTIHWNQTKALSLHKPIAQPFLASTQRFRRRNAAGVEIDRHLNWNRHIDYMVKVKSTYFYSPLDGMPVHRRVTPSIKFAGTHLYTWVERGTVRVKCLAQEHNTMSPDRARTRTARSGDERTNHEATAPIDYMITKLNARSVLLKEPKSSGGSTGGVGGEGSPSPLPLILAGKKEEMREGRKAGRASKTKPDLLLCSRSGFATEKYPKSVS